MNQMQRQLLLLMPMHLRLRVIFDQWLNNNLKKMMLGMLLFQLLFHKGLLLNQLDQQGIMHKLHYFRTYQQFYKLELRQLVIREYYCIQLLIQLCRFLVLHCIQWLIVLNLQKLLLELDQQLKINIFNLLYPYKDILLQLQLQINTIVQHKYQ